jgi:hypothetical protein
MPIGEVRFLGSGLSNHGGPTSNYMGVTVANDDATTAQAAGDLVNPLLIDDATAHWVQIQDGVTRLFPRARVSAEADTFTASPVVFLFGTDVDPALTASPRRVWRIDAADDFNAAGITLTLAGSGLFIDATWIHSDFPSADGYDALGAKWVMCAVGTAANILDDATPLPVFIDLYGVN